VDKNGISPKKQLITNLEKIEQIEGMLPLIEDEIQFNKGKDNNFNNKNDENSNYIISCKTGYGVNERQGKEEENKTLLVKRLIANSDKFKFSFLLFF